MYLLMKEREILFHMFHIPWIVKVAHLDELVIGFLISPITNSLGVEMVNVMKIIMRERKN